MSGKILSLAEIESIARENLSNFEGEQYEGEQYEGESYEGESYEGVDAFGGDDFVQYDGINLAKNGGQTFTFTVANANAATRTVALCGGIDRNFVGLVKTGAFNDVNNAAGLTGSGQPKAIEVFTEFVRNNPLRISTIQIASTDAAQTYQTMVMKMDSPFRDLESKNIPLQAHVSPGDFKDKLVIVPAHQYGIQFDNQTVLLLPIPGSSTATITIYVGPILNASGALANKYSKAVKRVSGVVRKRMPAKK